MSLLLLFYFLWAEGESVTDAESLTLQKYHGLEYSDDKVDRVQGQVEELKGIMVRNIGESQTRSLFFCDFQATQVAW